MVSWRVPLSRMRGEHTVLRKSEVGRVVKRPFWRANGYGRV